MQDCLEIYVSYWIPSFEKEIISLMKEIISLMDNQPSSLRNGTGGIV